VIIISLFIYFLFINYWNFILFNYLIIFCLIIFLFFFFILAIFIKYLIVLIYINLLLFLFPGQNGRPDDNTNDFACVESFLQEISLDLLVNGNVTRVTNKYEQRFMMFINFSETRYFRFSQQRMFFEMDSDGVNSRNHA